MIFLCRESEKCLENIFVKKNKFSGIMVEEQIDNFDEDFQRYAASFISICLSFVLLFDVMWG